VNKTLLDVDIPYLHWPHIKSLLYRLLTEICFHSFKYFILTFVQFVEKMGQLYDASSILKFATIVQ
jgi:hypothetical protein